MILDGNSRVGEAKVYATAKEMEQAKRLEKIKEDLVKVQNAYDVICDRLQTFSLLQVMDKDAMFNDMRALRSCIQELGKK